MQNKIIPKVLIVDDLRDSRMMIKMTLKKNDSYHFLEASNGKEGLEIAIKESPHIILMDAVMPIMDGFEAIKLLRNDDTTKKIPILMVSILDKEDDKVKALKSGISDFISKPFDQTELIIRVNSLINLYIEFLQQEQKLMELNKELDEHKSHLELKVQEEIQKREEKEKILFRQTRLASMGEMMDAVAHQWYQPLNIISTQITSLKVQIALEKTTKESLTYIEHGISKQIEHMTDTLNEFRSFFRPSKNTIDFNVKKMIEKVLLLIKDELIKEAITVEIQNFNESQDFTLHGIENEFKHLILTIINNSKDAFIENETKDRKISINLFMDNEYKGIKIVDNAGGIPIDIIEDIFKANVTTKEANKGTGIGLYISSQIAQKYHATLTAQNIKDGAKVIFKCKVDS